MTDALSRRLKQSRFASPQQEALLSILVAAGSINAVLDEFCAKHSISRTQYNVLRILRGVHPDGHARCEIAQRMVERSPDITRLVDRLQKQGLVRRTQGGADRRHSITRITTKGLKLLDSMQSDLDARTLAQFQTLSARDCAELSRLCALVFDNQAALPADD